MSFKERCLRKNLLMDKMFEKESIKNLLTEKSINGNDVLRK